jgi:hypothetical protein
MSLCNLKNVRNFGGMIGNSNIEETTFQSCAIECQLSHTSLASSKFIATNTDFDLNESTFYSCIFDTCQVTVQGQGGFRSCRFAECQFILDSSSNKGVVVENCEFGDSSLEMIETDTPLTLGTTTIRSCSRVFLMAAVRAQDELTLEESYGCVIVVDSPGCSDEAIINWYGQLAMLSLPRHGNSTMKHVERVEAAVQGRFSQTEIAWIIKSVKGYYENSVGRGKGK